MVTLEPSSREMRTALGRLVLRRPVPAAAHPAARAWVTLAHRWRGRVSSAYAISIVFVLFLLAFLLTGQVVLGVLALAMVPAYASAMAVWGGAHAWERVEDSAPKHSAETPVGPPPPGPRTDVPAVRFVVACGVAWLMLRALRSRHP